ncbi:Gpi1-domain-containing protein [Wolfiporia cocos MD-104 SS10]|uniref:Gpi1-domain-containing protein n=1 Tax=Wolfiporia cocos (strain MD-104) TaxID=742152 RepID=A0A2H3JLG9_WOLCO|nr:Gpi1-domain-containing protein [Wolfiporia cocos MD-104 SS10]
MRQQDTSTVFWPIDLLPCSGFCYGWDSDPICVAGIVQADTKDAAEKILSVAQNDPHWLALWDHRAKSAVVLGHCSVSDRREVIVRLGHVTLNPLNPGNGQPRTVVHYQRPKRDAMRFYSLDSRELDILYSQIVIPSTSPLYQKSVEVLEQDFTRPLLASPFDNETLNQINAAYSLANIVSRTALGNIENIGALHSSPSVQSGSRATTTDLECNGRHLRRMKLLLFAIYHLLSNLLITVEQIDVRAEQARFMYNHVPAIRSNENSSSIDSISRYIKFYNCVWLVLNDIIIGVAFGSFLCENSLLLSQLLDYYAQSYLVNSIRQGLMWLNNWPAGLKLNTELSEFYCHTFIGTISIWGHVLQNAAPYYPSILWIVGAMGCCGMTMIVSLLSDLLNILTLHIYLCYCLSTAAFSLELSLSASLWNLFRGKRYNVLRNRLDSWDYDMDQLLLGTILFVLVAFLYPTVLVYYALFAITYLAIILVQAVLDTVSALLNHFPLFALMLRVKDPMRLPGFIRARGTVQKQLV